MDNVGVSRVPTPSVMPAARFAARQQWHFLICVAFPTAVTIFGPFAFASNLLPIGSGLMVAALCWLCTAGFGITLGFHRLLAHRSFVTGEATKKILAGLGCTACQGPPSYWVSIHRMHHSLSDVPGDPHSPNMSAWPKFNATRAFIQGHLLWVISHDVPRASRYAPDLQRDRSVQWVDQRYWYFAFAGILVPAFFVLLVARQIYGISHALIFGAYWGGFFRIAVGHHIIWLVNSWCHTHGDQPNNTGDSSRNSWALALLSFGESWHNNHHAQPGSAKFSQHWWEVDIGWCLLLLLRILGLAKGIKIFKLDADS